MRSFRRFTQSMNVCLAISALGFLGCQKAFEPEKPQPQKIAVRVTGDPGKPVKGAEVTYQGKTIARSDRDGVAKLELSGREGDAYEVHVECPDGYESNNKAITIKVRKLAEPGSIPEYDATCLPTSRTVVVAVRAENAPYLPVMFLGREVARTDGSGAAHVLLRDVRRDGQFELTLSTKENEYLRPKNPSASFSLKGNDDVFTLDQKFTLEEKKVEKPKVWAAPPKPMKLPTRGGG